MESAAAQQLHNVAHGARVARPAPGASRPSGLAHGLLASLVALAAVGIVLAASGAWHYYATPLRVRAYQPWHRLLRPSGTIGQSLGFIGLALMTMPIIYSVRKKWSRLSRLGQMKTWLEVHIFCGTVGPILVTLHAALRFNGLVSVAYWSAIAVMLSGFVGRYLYIRMPRTIRGAEMTYDEIRVQAATVRVELEASGLSDALLAKLDRLEAAALGDDEEEGALALSTWEYRRRLRHLRREMRDAGVAPDLTTRALALSRERVQLLRRLRYLDRTRRLFAMWHVFHQPLVYLMFIIVALHIGLAFYLGYVPFLSR